MDLHPPRPAHGGGRQKYLRTMAGAEDLNPTIFEKARMAARSQRRLKFSEAKLSKPKQDSSKKFAIRESSDACDMSSRLRRAPSTATATSASSLAVPRQQRNGSREKPAASESSNRPNVMIKVPATPEGVPAIRLASRRRLEHNITASSRSPTTRKLPKPTSPPSKDRAARASRSTICQRRHFFVRPH